MSDAAAGAAKSSTVYREFFVAVGTEQTRRGNTFIVDLSGSCDGAPTIPHRSPRGAEARDAVVALTTVAPPVMSRADVMLVAGKIVVPSSVKNTTPESVSMMTTPLLPWDHAFVDGFAR